MSTKEKETTYKDYLESEEKNAAKASNVSYNNYVQSDSVKQAQDKLNQYTQNKPGAYTSQWQTSLNDTLNKILNREKFNYDLNGDALYQQYKNQYTTQGVQAMMDTMGQAQAMTGGYGNTYAQTAGQQAYQGYLQQLNDKVPELYQLALNQYNQEGENLYNQYGLFADRDNQDYGRYRDQLNDYNTELNRLNEDYRYQSESDYGRFADQLNLQYQQSRDAAADAQWQAEFDEAVRQYNINKGIITGGGSGTGGSGTGTGGSGNNDTLAIQKQLNAMGANIAEDGIWGSETQAAYDKYIGGGSTSAEAIVRAKSAAGAERNDIMRYLQAANKAKEISDDEYVRLMSAYASTGL